MPDFFLGLYQYGTNRISPGSRYAENDFNDSANADLSHCQINADVMTPKPNESTAPTQLNSEEEKSCDKCGRSEIPIQIKYQTLEPENSPKRENKDAKSLRKEVDGLKTRMDYFDIRFGCIEKALFSKKE